MNFERLYELLGDEQMVKKFLAMFCEQTPQQLKTMKDSATAGEWEMVSVTAHAIKSQLRYLGLDELAESAWKIESLAESAVEKEAIPGRIASLENSIDAIIRELTA